MAIIVSFMLFTIFSMQSHCNFLNIFRSDICCHYGRNWQGNLVSTVDMEKHVQVTSLHCDAASPFFLASETQTPCIAQLVEHLTANWGVIGLFPAFGSYIVLAKSFFSYTTADLDFATIFHPLLGCSLQDCPVLYTLFLFVWFWYFLWWV